MKQLSIYDEFFNPHEGIISPPAPLQTHEIIPNSTATANAAANVTEIILTRDKADCMQSLLPMLTHLNNESRWLAWVDPPITLLKQWQHQFHSRTHQAGKSSDIMILRSSASISGFALTEKALKAGTCHAVIAWTKGLNHDEFSKLEQASSDGNSHGIILRYR